MIQAEPVGHQTENHTLHNGYYWKKIGTVNWSLLISCIDKFDPIFWGICQSTYHGKNDKVSADHAIKIGSSLKLIQVFDLEILVRIEDGYQGAPGRRRVRGQFTLNNIAYLMSITDPEIEEQYLGKGNGIYFVGQAVLCVSLAEVYNEFAFRVIASLITPERCKQINGN